MYIYFKCFTSLLSFFWIECADLTNKKNPRLDTRINIVSVRQKSLINDRLLSNAVITVGKKLLKDIYPNHDRHGTNIVGFSLAFATSICGWQTSTQTTYIQHQLRDHLCHCLYNKTLTYSPGNGEKESKTMCME